MKADLRDRWCAALRSGNYRQTTGDLWQLMPNGKMGYCCLGVLQIAASIPFKKIDDPHGEETANSLLTDYVARKVGLPTARSKAYDNVSEKNLQKQLAELNKKRNFAEIADWIEQNVPVDQLTKAA